MMRKFYQTLFISMIIWQYVNCKKIINDEIVLDKIENVTIIKIIDMVDSSKDCRFGNCYDSLTFMKKVLNTSDELSQITSLLDSMKKFKLLRFVTKAITTYSVIINLKNMEPLQYDVCSKRIKYVNELTYWYDEKDDCLNLLDSIFCSR